MVIGYKTGSTVYQLAEQFGINRKTVSKVLERKAYLAADVPYPQRTSSRPPNCTPLVCHWSALEAAWVRRLALCTLPSGGLVFGRGTLRGESRRPPFAGLLGAGACG